MTHEEREALAKAIEAQAKVIASRADHVERNWPDEEHDSIEFARGASFGLLEAARSVRNHPIAPDDEARRLEEEVERLRGLLRLALAELEGHRLEGTWEETVAALKAALESGRASS